MTGHHELQCTIHPLGTLSPLRFVVVCSFYEGRLLLSYHRVHQSWETQGGHIEEGETAEAAARRELYEESGVTDAELLPVCDYFAFDSEGSASGRVYAARVHSLGRLPESEMSKLQGLEHVSLNTVSYHPHHSHFSLDEALSMADRIGAKHTWLTHLSHTFPSHAAFCDELRRLCAERAIRSDVQPAYDGLTVTAP